MRFICLVLMGLILSVSAAQAKDADCFDRSKKLQWEACTEIINTKRLNGKRLSDKRLAEIYFQRGLIPYYKRPRSSNRTDDFTKSINLHPTPRAYYERGKSLASTQRNDNTEARSDFEMVLKLDSEGGKYHQAALRALKDLDATNEKTESAWEAVQRKNREAKLKQKQLEKRANLDQPEKVETPINDADCFSKNGDITIEACTRIVNTKRMNGKIIEDKNLARIYSYRASMFHDKGLYDQAINDYARAIGLDPEYKIAYQNRGVAYGEKRLWDQAIDDFNKVIGLDPKYAIGYRNRARAYMEKGLMDQAKSDLDKAIQLNPKEVRSFGNRGLIFRLKGLHNRAIDDFTKAIQLDPKNELHYNERALTYVSKGLYDKAIADYDQAIRLNPKEKASYNGRAHVHNKLGNYDQAVEDASQAIALDPKFAYAYRHRGVAYSKKGDYKRAIAEFDRAIQLDPKYKEAIESRQIAVQEMKQKEALRGESVSTKKQTKVANVQPKPKVITRTGKRIALVIGNDNYSNLPAHYQLKKAQNDARSTAATFKELGFDVMSGFDLKRRDMNIKLSKLAAKIEPGDEVMFFFAGHGVRIEGRNYLLPSDVPEISDANEDLLKSESLHVDAISDMFRKKGARLSLLVLDACRNNPYKDNRGRSVGGTRGLAPMDPPEGTLVLFSAGAGQEALDGLTNDDKNPNSVFTRTFLPMVKQEGLELSRLSRLVKAKVRDLARTVGHKQTPAVYNEVIGDVYLAAQ